MSALQRIETDSAPLSRSPVSQAVRAGDMVYVSGQVAWSQEGSLIVDDFEAEVGMALGNLEAILLAAGAGLSDVCKVNAYLADASLVGEFNRIYAKIFAGSPPARTTVCAQLVLPEARVEVDAIAYAPPDRSRPGE